LGKHLKILVFCAMDWRASSNGFRSE
jgi:hypothetical protein